MNNVFITGRLTADPELRATNEGTSVTTFTVAVDRRFAKNKEADFFNVVAWKQLAELINKYVGKGNRITVNGRLQTRQYEKNGEKKRITEIVAEEVEFIDFKDKKEESAPEGFTEVDIPDTDLPF